MLDTSAVSALMRGAATDEPLQALVAGRSHLVSFVTVGELLHGAVKRGWSGQRLAQLETRIAGIAVVPGSIVVARNYARLKARFGTSKQDNDLWIAASAMIDEPPLPIATLDKDFDEIGEFAGIQILRPGQAST